MVLAQVNDGAQSSEGWSRLQYQKNIQKYPNVLRVRQPFFLEIYTVEKQTMIFSLTTKDRPAVADASFVSWSIFVISQALFV